MATDISPIGRGPFDKKLVTLFAANMTPDEVSAELNNVLSPAQCLDRIKKILASRDILDAEERLALVLEDVYWLRAKLRDQMEDANYIKVDEAKVWLTTLDSIAKRIETASMGMSDMMMRVKEVHARLMAQAIRVGFEGALLELQKRYEIEEAEAYEVLEQAIPVAFDSLMDNNPDE